MVSASIRTQKIRRRGETGRKWGRSPPSHDGGDLPGAVSWHAATHILTVVVPQGIMIHSTHLLSVNTPPHLHLHLECLWYNKQNHLTHANSTSHGLARLLLFDNRARHVELTKVDDELRRAGIGRHVLNDHRAPPRFPARHAPFQPFSSLPFLFHADPNTQNKLARAAAGLFVAIALSPASNAHPSNGVTMSFRPSVIAGVIPQILVDFLPRSFGTLAKLEHTTPVDPAPRKLLLRLHTQSIARRKKSFDTSSLDLATNTHAEGRRLP